jgi:hypothetical protein
MKLKPKVIEIPAGSTPNQIEDLLKSNLKKGFSVVSIFNLGTKTYALLERKGVL